MREKLLHLMKNEELTSSRLAELLGIQPSGISHILKGRNNPSLDFIQKILRRFPQVNPDWLILGEGEMYRSSETPSQNSLNLSTASNQTVATSVSPDSPKTESASSDQNTPNVAQSSDQNFRTESNSISNPIIDAAQRSTSRVKRVIILFEDRTFESYEMK